MLMGQEAFRVASVVREIRTFAMGFEVLDRAENLHDGPE